MTFSQSISTCFNKYATFSGRASRSEYWWFYLFNCLVTTAAMILDMALGFDVEVVRYLTTLALLLPGLAVAVRRCHDTNHSGWWILCPIYNIILMLIPSDAEENDYGTLEEE